jgi:hypothetical protein
LFPRITKDTIMKANTKKAPAASRTPGRRLQLMMGTRHDPYQTRRKPTSPSVCPVCKLVFQKGRWQVGPAPAGAHSEICPACHRMRDKFPAGYLTIEGPWAYEYRKEVLRTARNFAERMQAEHPLQRIMAIEESGDKVVITTTDIHLAQGIGRALHHAYHGNLVYSFSESEYQLRVTWAC